jgi:hypothetical protein
LKGPIQQIRFGFRIEAKIDEVKEGTDFLSSLSVFDYSWCKMVSPFSKPTVGYWEANYKNEKLFEYMDLKSFHRDYNLDTQVDEIRKDGRNMRVDDLNIPKSVKDYWKNQDFIFFKELYIKDIVKEVLDKEYLPEYEYVNQKTDSILKMKDELCFNFLRIPIDELMK